MLTVLMMMGVGGTLMAVALASMLQSQDRVAEFANRLARTSDFLQWVRRDVRGATNATLREGDGAELRQVLLIGNPPTQISYRFFKQRVERTEGGAAGTTKSWDSMAAKVSLVAAPDTVEAGGVGVSVFWHRTGAKDPEPDRRFDLVVRCGGEQTNVDD
jgi:hypothetical protein